MSICYNIQPDLDLLLYKIKGECTAGEYFDLNHVVYQDPKRHHGMKVLFDLTDAAINFDAESLKVATSIVVENKEGQFPPDLVGVLTRESSFYYLADTLILMAEDVKRHLKVFHNIKGAIRWLRLSEWEDESLLFWKTSM